MKKTKTIEWNDFMNGISNFNIENNNEELTNIRCPKCGEKVYKLNNQIYTSYPPKHKYICKKCGWVGYT